MKSRAIVGAAAVLLSALLFVSAITLIPMRITYGAGSFRCGTALAPDRDEGVDCEEIAPARIRRAAAGSIALVLFALIAMVPGYLARRNTSIRIILDVLAAFAYLIAFALVVFAITGASSALGTA